jgi:hypothetical protein
LYAQTHERNTRLLPKLLKKEKLLDSILDNPDVYDVQIIYSQINRKKGMVNFLDCHYNVDKREYFYPSTAVFLPVAALTLEKVGQLSDKHNVSKDTYVKIDHALTNETIVYYADSTNRGHVSLAHFIKNMFVSGDEQSCNFCYDFLTQHHLNERMHSLGYGNSWFLHKFGHTLEDSRHSHAVTFFCTDVQSFYIDIVTLKRYPTTIPFSSIYEKKAEYNHNDYSTTIKKLYSGKKNSKKSAETDFIYHNKFTIEDMHGFLKLLTYPEAHKKQLNLSDEDYSFLLRQMMVNDSNSNYIFNDKLSDTTIKIFNNSGRDKDLGFMVDNAYIVDPETGIDFFLTVAIKCNEKCEDKTLLSFIKNVSNIIYQYELGRKKNGLAPHNFLDRIK